MRCTGSTGSFCWSLNESPSEKEGKYGFLDRVSASTSALNESPSEKEGKCKSFVLSARLLWPLNESPSEKEGKLVGYSSRPAWLPRPSMKVPPKRKGNLAHT